MSETPAVLSLCFHCEGFLISHGWEKRIKVTVANLEELERSPEDDEVEDHIKQAWKKVKVDLSSGEDAVHDDGDPNMEVTEEEGEKKFDDDDFDMERLQAEKNEYGVKDEIDEFLDQEKNKVEKVPEEEQENDDGG